MAEQQQTSAQALRCQECLRVWGDPWKRWRVYLTCDEPPVAITYCRLSAASS
jgi:hypothetical protein